MGLCNSSASPFIEIGDYEFNPNDLIGTGQDGPLFQGSPKKNRLFEVAVKQVNRTFNSENYEQVEQVLKKLMTPNDTNVARYIDYYYSNENTKLYLIIEFCAHGNLSNIIQNPIKISPSEDLMIGLGYCKQLIKGLQILHDNNIIHGNLKPHSVLVHYDILKISDYGMLNLEKLSIEGTKKKFSIYKSPEMFLERPELTEKSDIWSLGVIMYQIVYKARPLDINNGKHRITGIKTGKCEQFDDLIGKCLKLDPEARIGPDELRRHPFLSFDVNNITGILETLESQKEL